MSAWLCGAFSVTFLNFCASHFRTLFSYVTVIWMPWISVTVYGSRSYGDYLFVWGCRSSTAFLGWML